MSDMRAAVVSSALDAFELIKTEQIPEIASEARYYRHKKTGAEVLSLINHDENKVFGVTLKTPPEDSTGVAHILEHSVLCGSRKYPVKKPFVELLKGSLHTFLNAMTFSDKTAYPVASQNLQDFYNLVDVYLDAVFFPLISEDTFRQEGWHHELDATQGPLVYKGVVFNEMKGAYSSPGAVLAKAVQMSVYPDNAYGVDSGGDPKAIPDLTYAYFKNFHKTYYHPSNARVVFYGDDDPDRRLEILEEYFSQFERAEVDAAVKPQPKFTAPRKLAQTYAASDDVPIERSAMVSVQWMLDRPKDEAASLALDLFETVLVGNSAAPLRKALMDSRLGEGLSGAGVSFEYLQPMFRIGLKGIAPDAGDRVEQLVLETLERLAREGIAEETIASAMNTVEFHLRENNTGALPRGISLMLRAMTSWLHGGDPTAPLKFESDLAALKARLAAGERVFENMIRSELLDNPHRTTVLLTADPDKGAKDAEEEREKLAALRDTLNPEAVQQIIEQTQALKALQAAGDPPEALKRIPGLTVPDLPVEIRTIPMEVTEVQGATLFTHDLDTSGIIYLEVGFDLHVLPPEYLPYVPIFSRALLQTGAGNHDFVALSQRIGRLTGGVGAPRVIAPKQGEDVAAAWQFLRGKATEEHFDDLLGILRDVITDARLDNRERIRQMVAEEKAGLESSLAGIGNQLVSLRLRAGLNEADWAGERMGGVSYLFFIRELLKEVETEWPTVQLKLEAIRDMLVNRAAMVVNVTAPQALIEVIRPRLDMFIGTMPTKPVVPASWARSAEKSEGLIMPAQVNYVAKGADLRRFGYEPSGATSVAIKYLNTTYLWDKVRVEGGAYGGGSSFDPFTGAFTFSSYRDPNLLGTLDIYDGASQFLKKDLSAQDLTRSIVGVIGAVDSYQLPDAKGFTAMVRYLTNISDADRQKRRDEILNARSEDFRKLADALALVAQEGKVVVLGGEAAIREANAERGNFLEVSRVL